MSVRYKNQSGPACSKPRGAGGLRNPVFESRPGPEATVFRFPFQLDPRLTEKGQQYESIDEFVSAAVARKCATQRAYAPLVCLLLPPGSGAIIVRSQMEAVMRLEPGDTDPSQSHGGESQGTHPFAPASRVTFDRRELDRIFNLYGRKVAAGVKASLRSVISRARPGPSK